MDCNSIEGGAEGILEALVADGLPLPEADQVSPLPIQAVVDVHVCKTLTLFT